MACNCENGGCGCKIPKETIRIPILSEEVDLIHRLLFEKDGYENIVVQFCSDSPYRPNDDNFEKTIDMYLKACVNYNLGYNNILNNYKHIFIDKIKSADFDSQINFFTDEILINIY